MPANQHITLTPEKNMYPSVCPYGRGKTHLLCLVLVLTSVSFGPIGAQEGEKELQQVPAGKEQPEPAMAVEMEAGKNLFGTRIAEVAKDDTPSISESADVKRAKTMIDETINLVQVQTGLEASQLALNQRIRQMQIEYDQLPEKYQQQMAELIGTQLKMESLTPALRLGRSHPQFQEYFQLKEYAKGLTASIALLEKKKQTLPVEMRNLLPERDNTNKSRVANEKKSRDIMEGWKKLLSLLRFVPKRDATQILSHCQEKLIRYPELAPLRIMCALCHVHLDRPRAGIADFSAAIKLLNNDSSGLRVPCLIGTAWALLDDGELDQAGAKIAEVRKLSKRNYEITLCEARLAEARGQLSNAVGAYRRAMAIAPRESSAYRMAAIMVCRTNVRPPAIALSLAEEACERDEFDDFRNSVALAWAHAACEDESACESAIEAARRDAGIAGQEPVEQMIGELLANRKTESGTR
ncbi:MAG: hypothetical protein AAGD07_07260 [Planctomycetota bacterium]